MDQFISQPIFSSLTSILLLTGCYQTGKIIINSFGLKKVISLISTIEFQYLSFGIVFLLIILFPLVAFTQHAKLILQFFGVILFFLSFFWGKDILTSSKKFNKILYLQCLILHQSLCHKLQFLGLLFLKNLIPC